MTPSQTKLLEDLRSGAVRLVPGWQPMSTAPKDGTVIDLWARSFGPVSRDSDEQRIYVEFRVTDACWFMGEWATAEGGSLDLGDFDNLVFSHWAPRIAPPDTASPDLTPALVEMIEGLVWDLGKQTARALTAEAERDALMEALGYCEQYGSEAVKLIARHAIKEAPDV